MIVSRRIAQFGLGAALLILLASMLVVFVGSSQAKQQNPSYNADQTAYDQPLLQPSR
ncbi:MAG TPA: hypothetical protein VHS31_13670 [Tepidisphaeraceae bacterium]|jgi:hypothetical protein|nr:hypothetical protein [Tepidisphaeraceae bacterium]